jgi:hypothetical protein
MRPIGRKVFALASGRGATTLRATMAWKRKATGGVLAFIGYILSPLSWWNDAFVNIPLALAFAWVVALFYKPAFEASWVLGYWLTNIIGMVMMQKGAEKMLRKEDRKYSWRDSVRDIGISLVYTGIIVLLLKLGIVKPIHFSR